MRRQAIKPLEIPEVPRGPLEALQPSSRLIKERSEMLAITFGRGPLIVVEVLAMLAHEVDDEMRYVEPEDTILGIAALFEPRVNVLNGSLHVENRSHRQGYDVTWIPIAKIVHIDDT